MPNSLVTKTAIIVHEIPEKGPLALVRAIQDGWIAPPWEVTGDNSNIQKFPPYLVLTAKEAGLE